PPLRERPSDIPLLVHYFVSRFSRRMQKQIKTIPKRAMEALANSAWPGYEQRRWLSVLQCDASRGRTLALAI
ncbi:MAG TPA: hypothetical protein VGQ12_17920, partial [Candidatus Angelobacter sp.]|nr:hypothetical protein [Candidatus Angelobacter sp.]